MHLVVTVPVLVNSPSLRDVMTGKDKVQGYVRLLSTTGFIQDHSGSPLSLPSTLLSHPVSLKFLVLAT